ncbi:MAG TPA: sn-glycerol-3-phosphate ABC transporter ATP-binding protein UgpC [Thermotogota bacterium]|nr:sn-glycerol-3-phosphate ABC transporter ATP-binding protein UgpC [Thermotogota bacterium]HRW91664.1 sn-glycerol-3-phosphate ABC transporter ATP-binding protein UgpC [Thermotogota bacterium]
MAQVLLEKVWKIYDGKVEAVQDANFTVEDREFVVLLGPSGCGKTTTLRMVAGLEEITKGTVKIDDKVVNDVEPKDRDIAMVFQNYALYPHMTVYDNMAFGLKLRKFPKEEIKQRVDEAARILSIEPLLDRKPKQLSGGQRQRVAVGRAIVRNPKVFLFDEPLSNLDAKLRVQMRAELKKLHLRLDATIIYVTHDQIEAMTMADKIVIMRDGRIQQIGDPYTIYNHPANVFVGGFIGTPPMNFADVKVTKGKGGYVLRETSGGFEVTVPDKLADQVAPWNDKEVKFGIRPEDIYDKLYSMSADDNKNVVKATVEVTEPLGSETILHVVLGQAQVVASVNPASKAREGQQMDLVFDMSKMHLFNPETEESIF